MSCLAVSENALAVTKNLFIDYFFNHQHYIHNVIPQCKTPATDYIVDIILSSDDKHLAVITALSKELLIFDLPAFASPKRYLLPRSASKIRFTNTNTQILVADKSGDALIYNITSDDSTGVKLLGHLSLLLDIVQTNDGRYIITSDRDEKIKVSCYPNTYNIQTYCLGHREFVNHLELLPQNQSCLLSTSGDGTINLWNYVNGNIYHSIDTYSDINNEQLRKSFIKAMDDEGVQVNALPIVHFTLTEFNENCCILAVTVHTVHQVLIYSLNFDNDMFSHKFETKLMLNNFPSSIKFNKSRLFVFDGKQTDVFVYKMNDDKKFVLDTKIEMFKNTVINTNLNLNDFDSIKVLYKRKFDNVQEYQERKKQRLEKSL